jgi:rhodanese-related sulfurtransferase
MTSPHRRFKDALYEQIARIGKALSAPKRLELLDLLSQGPRTVEALADQASLSMANASQHLQVLRAARLVEVEKKGLYVEYRLASTDVGALFLSLRGVAASRLTEVEHLTRMYFATRGTLEAVSGEELLRRMARGEVTALDVRPREEYRAGHFPNAVSIPLDELQSRLSELPKSREVVAYCRGPCCVMAIDAVTLLREHGFKARHMELGVLDFRARGLRIETEHEGARA